MRDILPPVYKNAANSIDQSIGFAGSEIANLNTVRAFASLKRTTTGTAVEKWLHVRFSLGLALRTGSFLPHHASYTKFERPRVIGVNRIHQILEWPNNFPRC